LYWCRIRRRSRWSCYGHRAWPGGGRTSARETIGRVAAGAIAKKLLRDFWGVEVLACVTQVQHLKANVDPENFTSEAVESNILRCPDAAAAPAMIRPVSPMVAPMVRRFNIVRPRRTAAASSGSASMAAMSSR
jgi:hypothetical protein